MDAFIYKRAEKWLQDEFDADTRANVRELMENNPKELTEAFYRDLEFGTGGLRGIMGVGTNRMNKYTVAMATQGLANYLIKQFRHSGSISVAIAFDTRNNSKFFAGVAAEVLSANNISVFIFDDVRPTPELSFTIRSLNCKAGIVITASHNPKEYNGYKVYWEDGAQIIHPHDENIIKEVKQISDLSLVNFKTNSNLIFPVIDSIDQLYLNKIKELSLLDENIIQNTTLKIVYTPLHGTGYKLVPLALAKYGFKNVSTVKEQLTPDGFFPTVKSPNPEESSALSMAIRQAENEGADLVMATDPDADRVGVAVKDRNGNFVLLNGNQTASVLIYYLLKMWKLQGKLTSKEFIVKTIVTTELLKAIAVKEKVECFDVLTGFKYIADIIRKQEGLMTFIGGGEESYGYLAGDFVRDKDAVISCCLIAEAAVYAASINMNLLELLNQIYIEYGFYKEKLISIERKGKEGAKQIKKIMCDYRNNPPLVINNSKVILIKDFLLQKEIDLVADKTQKKLICQFLM